MLDTPKRFCFSVCAHIVIYISDRIEFLCIDTRITICNFLLSLLRLTKSSAIRFHVVFRVITIVNILYALSNTQSICINKRADYPVQSRVHSIIKPK